MAGLIGTNLISQVGFIVKDIEKSKQTFAEFFGVPTPEHFDGGEYEITQTTVNSEPAPHANCLMAFFTVGDGVQIELIQPNGVKSTWQDFLDTHGEGIHHIAFNVKGMDKIVTNCKDWGLDCLQHGKYGGGGGEYTYLDATNKMHCILELLENY